MQLINRVESLESEIEDVRVAREGVEEELHHTRSHFSGTKSRLPPRMPTKKHQNKVKAIKAGNMTTQIGVANPRWAGTNG